MLTAAYVGNRTIDLQTVPALPPSRGQVAHPRRLRRTLRHGPAHRSRVHGPAGAGAVDLRPRDERNRSRRSAAASMVGRSVTK